MLDFFGRVVHDNDSLETARRRARSASAWATVQAGLRRSSSAAVAWRLTARVGYTPPVRRAPLALVALVVAAPMLVGRRRCSPADDGIATDEVRRATVTEVVDVPGVRDRQGRRHADRARRRHAGHPGRRARRDRGQGRGRRRHRLAVGPASGWPTRRRRSPRPSRAGRRRRARWTCPAAQRAWTRPPPMRSRRPGRPPSRSPTSRSRALCSPRWRRREQHYEATAATPAAAAPAGAAGARRHRRGRRRPRRGPAGPGPGGVRRRRGHGGRADPAGADRRRGPVRPAAGGRLDRPAARAARRGAGGAGPPAAGRRSARGVGQAWPASTTSSPSATRCSAGAAIVTIVDISEIGLVGEVDETDVLLVAPGVAADVELDAAPGLRFEATVEHGRPAAHPVGAGRCRLPDPARLPRGRARAGRAGAADAAAGHERGGPSAGPHRDRRAWPSRRPPCSPSADGDTVWVVRDGRAVRQHGHGRRAGRGPGRDRPRAAARAAGRGQRGGQGHRRPGAAG